MSTFEEGEPEPPICDYCGTYILEVDQECSAIDEGVCEP